MLHHVHNPIRLARRVLLPCLIVLAFIAGAAASAPGAVTASPPQTPAGGLAGGAVGTSYSFARSFGTLKEPYLVDTAHFNKPGGIYIDSSGRLFEAEEAGSRVLRIDLNDPSSAFSYGDPAVSRPNGKYLYNPLEVLTDSDGNVWVTIQHAVKKLTAAGDLIVMLPNAETGDTWITGSDNGHFNNPFGLAMDSAGRLFVADRDNHRIQIFDVSGDSITYLATIGESGQNGSDNAHFFGPTRIAFDSLDRLYVMDSGNARVQRCEYNPVSTAWECSTFFGVTGEPGDDLTHLGQSGYGIKIKGDTLFLGDSLNSRVLKCTLAGVCAHFAGVNGEFGSDNSRFRWVSDIDVDPQGNVYVSDIDNYRVQKFNSAGVYQDTLGVTGVPYLTDLNHYNIPWGIAAGPDGSLYITESSGYRLIKMNSEGVQQWTVGTPGVRGDDNQHFGDYWDFLEGSPAVDAAGRVYVTDTANHRVQIFNANGSYYATMGVTRESGGDNAHFNCPAGVAISPLNGDIFVNDQCAHRIQVFNSSRVYKMTLGETFVAGGDNQHFDNPRGVAAALDGTLYVADVGNFRVQKCTLLPSSYTCETFAGTGMPGSAYNQVEPIAVAVDTAGRVFAADVWQARVLVFDPAGKFLTSIGGRCGSNNAELCGPSGVAVDKNNNVYVTDRYNMRVQKFTLGTAGWQQTNLNGFGDPDNGHAALVVFNDKLFAGVSNGIAGATVWSSEDGRTWTRTSDYAFDGVSIEANPAIGGFAVFNGKLYAGTRWGTENGQIWRTANGADWEQVSGGSAFSGLGSFAVFGGYLYAGTDSLSETSGAEIWRSDTGDSGDWELVPVPALTGDPANMTITSLVSYDGYLYAGVKNYGSGSQVWRSNNGTSWTRVDWGGFGEVGSNVCVHSMAVFNGKLYAGTTNEDTGGQVWRTDGSSWIKVVNAGFGDPNNRSIGSLYVFGPYLYAVTENHPYRADRTGVEVWRTSDGVNWSQVSPDGFGDANNTNSQYNSASVTAFQDALFVGVKNYANGTEVWRMHRQVYLPLLLR